LAISGCQASKGARDGAGGLLPGKSSDSSNQCIEAGSIGSGDDSTLKAMEHRIPKLHPFSQAFISMGFSDSIKNFTG
jgi:hypothetical protein